MPARIFRIEQTAQLGLAPQYQASAAEFGGLEGQALAVGGQQIAQQAAGALRDIQHYEAEKKKSKQALEGFSLLMDARLGLDDVKRQAKDENNHETYEQTVVSGSQRVTQETLVRTKDPEVKAFLQKELAQQGLKDRLEARDEARKLYVGQGRAQMAERLEVARDMILGTADPVARARLEGLVAGALKAQEGRLYNAEERQKLHAAFGRDLQEGQALIDMRVDPLATEDRLLKSGSGFEKIAPDTRARLAGQARGIADARAREDVRKAEKDEKDEEKRLERDRKAAVDEYDSRARAGTLGLEELEDARRNRVVMGGDYDRIYTLVKRDAAAGGRTDDAAYNAMELRLLSRETTGPRARREILALERGGKLAMSGPRSAATLLEMVKKDEEAKEGKDITKHPMFDQGQDDIKLALRAGKGPLESLDAVTATRVRNALREYHDIARSGKVAPSALPETARKITDRYLSEQPQLMGDPEPETQLLYRNPADLLKAREKGLVPDGEFNRQSDLFRKIEDQKKPGTKPTGGKK